MRYSPLDTFMYPTNLEIEKN